MSSVNDGELDRSGDDRIPTDSDDISTRVNYNIQYIFLSTSRFLQIKKQKNNNYERKNDVNEIYIDKQKGRKKKLLF
jgi:hypothetical protein